MSWDAYVNAYLTNIVDQNTGKTAYNVCDTSGIFSNANGVTWAATPGFGLLTYQATLENDDGTTKSAEVNEFNNLLNTFNSNGQCTLPGGVRLNNEKYFVVSFDGNAGLLYLKKAGGGACVARTGQAFVIGTFSTAKKLTNFNGVQEPQNAGFTNRACEGLQNILANLNL